MRLLAAWNHCSGVTPAGWPSGWLNSFAQRLHRPGLLAAFHRVDAAAQGVIRHQPQLAGAGGLLGVQARGLAEAFLVEGAAAEHAVDVAALAAGELLLALQAQQGRGAAQQIAVAIGLCQLGDQADQGVDAAGIGGESPAAGVARFSTSARNGARPSNRPLRADRSAARLLAA